MINKGGALNWYKNQTYKYSITKYIYQMRGMTIVMKNMERWYWTLDEKLEITKISFKDKHFFPSYSVNGLLLLFKFKVVKSFIFNYFILIWKYIPIFRSSPPQTYKPLNFVFPRNEIATINCEKYLQINPNVKRHAHVQFYRAFKERQNNAIILGQQYLYTRR